MIIGDVKMAMNLIRKTSKTTDVGNARGIHVAD